MNNNNFIQRLPFSLAIVGKPNSGKSHLIKYLLSLYTSKKNIYERFNYGLLFTKTLFNNTYADIIPAEWCYQTFNVNAIKRLLKIQKSYCEKGFKPPACFILFDDFISTSEMRFSQILSDIFMNYRHYNCSLIYSTQYLIAGLNTIMRDCVSHAVIFKIKSANSYAAIYNAWFGNMRNSEEFRQYINTTLTKDYTFIFVDNESSTTNYWPGIAPATFQAAKINYIKSVALNQLQQMQK